jgi:Mn-dependent DtxR family transcriptional regulator
MLAQEAAPVLPLLEHLNPTDVRILRFLRGAPSTRKPTGEIARALGLNPASIGKNLSKLKNMSLIDNVRRRGYALTQKGRSISL